MSSFGEIFKRLFDMVFGSWFSDCGIPVHGRISQRRAMQLDRVYFCVTTPGCPREIAIFPDELLKRNIIVHQKRSAEMNGYFTGLPGAIDCYTPPGYLPYSLKLDYLTPSSVAALFAVKEEPSTEDPRLNDCTVPARMISVRTGSRAGST